MTENLDRKLETIVIQGFPGLKIASLRLLKCCLGRHILIHGVEWSRGVEWYFWSWFFGVNASYLRSETTDLSVTPMPLLMNLADCN